jgi:uncharacterized coiled-coil protein SlyX
MQDDASEKVQSKIAHLERAMAELSDVVFRQHKEIKALDAQLRVVKERLEGASFEETRSAEQERPPHY